MLRINAGFLVIVIVFVAPISGRKPLLRIKKLGLLSRGRPFLFHKSNSVKYILAVTLNCHILTASFTIYCMLNLFEMCRFKKRDTYLFNN